LHNEAEHFTILYNGSKIFDILYNEKSDCNIQHLMTLSIVTFSIMALTFEDQHNTFWRNDSQIYYMQRNDTQHYNIQHNDTLHCNVLQSDTQHYDFQQNGTNHIILTLLI
jgi:hypothetical protein